MKTPLHLTKKQNFFDKINNQSKKLFNIAQDNDLNIPIPTLVEAQEVVAKLYDYNDWETLCKYLNQHEESSNIELPLLHNRKPYLEHEEHYYSFIEIKYLPYQDANSFQELLNVFNQNFYKEIQQYLNHIEIFVIKKEPLEEHGLFYLNPKVQVNEVKFNELNSYINPLEYNQGNMKIIFCIKTDKENENKHITLCDYLYHFFYHYDLLNLIKFKEEISKYEFNLFTHKSKHIAYNTKNTFFNSLFSFSNKKQNFTPEYWLQFINILEKTDSTGALSFNFNDKKIFYFSDNEQDIKKEITDALQNLQPKIDDIGNIAFTYQSQKLPWTQGLKFINLDNCPEYYDMDSDLFWSSNILISGNFSKKQYLTKLLILQNLFNQAKIKVGIITKENNYQDLYEHVSHLFPHRNIGYLSPQFNQNFELNIFDTPLGIRHAQNTRKDQYYFKISFLAVLFSQEIDTDRLQELSSFLTLLVDQAYNYYSDLNHPKKYIPALFPDIEQALNLYQFSITSETTWWEVVDILFLNKAETLAEKAQRYAVPTIRDLITILDQDTILKINTPEINVSIKKALNEFCFKYPNLSGVTTYKQYLFDFCVVNIDNLIQTGNNCDINNAIAILFAQLLLNNTTHNKSTLSSIYFSHDTIGPKTPTEEYENYYQLLSQRYKNSKNILVMDNTMNTIGNEAINNIICFKFIEEMRQLKNLENQIIFNENLANLDSKLIDLFNTKFCLSNNDSNYHILKSMYEIDTDSHYYMTHPNLAKEFIQNNYLLGLFQTCNGTITQILKLNENALIQSNKETYKSTKLSII